VGFIIAGIKELQAAKVGDTVTLIKAGTGGAAFTATEALPGFKEIQPQVFAGLYPVEANQYDSLRDSLEKLKLNDASLHYEPEVSQALGFGFRCGFLGLLHMEIVQERLEREFDQDLITTAPSVVYQVLRGDGEVIMVENPSKMPDQGQVQEIREPIVTVHLYMPQEYVGAVMTLANQKRGVQINMAYHGRQVMLTYELPLGEIVLDFFDKLKSVSRGYASMDYDLQGVPRLRRGEGRHPAQRREGRRAVHHRPPQPVAVPRPGGGGEDARDHQPPDVRRGDPGGHRRQHHRPRDHQGAAQERAGKMLRRRHQPQAQAPRKTKGGQETHEADRLGRSASGSVPRHPPGRRINDDAFPHRRGPRGFRRLCRRVVLRARRRQLRAAAVPGHHRHRPVLAGRAPVVPAAPPLAAAALEARRPRNGRLASQGIAPVDRRNWPKRSRRILAQPWWLDWTAGLFPVIIAVFVLRSFLFEPFKIPSGSMIPTLLVGDLILVNKFTYGLRLPVLNTKLTEGTPPKRGDVMVFRYPPKPSLDYIKRVVGVPGDEVAYLNKR
jgi:hypothetical protein